MLRHWKVNYMMILFQIFSQIEFLSLVVNAIQVSGVVNFFFSFDSLVSPSLNIQIRQFL
jgi:hypothetical protein